MRGLAVHCLTYAIVIHAQAKHQVKAMGLAVVQIAFT
jgi:hypothetical protein